MIQYSRKPAIIILAMVLGAGGIMVWKSSSASAGAGADSSIAQLEKQIADGHATGATWMRYGDCLAQLGRYPAAAAAYHKVLETQPASRDGRIDYALALARSGDSQTLYTFLHQLNSEDPKLTMTLLDHHECQSILGNQRFTSLYQDAKSQASD